MGKYDNVDGVIYRSRDGLTDFIEGPRLLPQVRHTALWVEGDRLYLLYTRIGDRPESILLATTDLRADWQKWSFSEPVCLLEPEMEWEGVQQPLLPSRPGAIKGQVRQLRDPAFYTEGDTRYLLYSVAGEQGIAIARLLH